MVQCTAGSHSGPLIIPCDKETWAYCAYKDVKSKKGQWWVRHHCISTARVSSEIKVLEFRHLWKSGTDGLELGSHKYPVSSVIMGCRSFFFFKHSFQTLLQTSTTTDHHCRPHNSPPSIYAQPTMLLIPAISIFLDQQSQCLAYLTKRRYVLMPNRDSSFPPLITMIQ